MPRNPFARGVARLLLCLSVLFILPTAGQAGSRFLPAEDRAVPDRYLVTLAPEVARWGTEAEDTGPAVREVAEQLVALYGGEIDTHWEHAVQGFAIELSEGQARKLADDPLVALVEQDRIVIEIGVQPLNCYGYDKHLEGEDHEGLAPRVTQSITCDDPDPRNPNRDCPNNWGLDRIDQVGSLRDGGYNYLNSGRYVDIYVIDTGINKDHLDFFEGGPPFTRVRSGHNAIPNNTSLPTSDCYNHGTHVAGIIGGEKSGVAKNVWLHPVKFLDRCDSAHPGGAVSHVLNGIDWVVQSHDVTTDGPAVVNFSGGNNEGTSATIASAVGNLLASGISFVQSAGNQLIDACERSVGGQPGLEAALVVGGTDTNLISSQWRDGLWKREGPSTTGGPPDPSYDDYCTGSFPDCGSNFGSCVDLFAPSAHIVSAFAEDTVDYCRLSGTSMAAPHVTGAAALYLYDNPTANPQQVHDALVGGATCGALDADPASPYYIGDGSPNLLLNSLLAGGGPAACNRPPECQDDYLETEVDTRLSIPLGHLLGNDSDPDGDAIRLSDYDRVTVQGGMNDSGHIGGFNYTPPSGFEGQDQFSYTISDRPGDTGLTATCQVFIDVQAAPPAELVIGEVGQVPNLRHLPRTVVLSRSYTSPIVIAQPVSFNGGDTAVVRITDVQSDRFTFYVHEAPNRDGPHNPEVVSYMVIEEGFWQLDNGVEISVGKLDTAATVGKNVSNVWETVIGGPNDVVFTQVQTNNDPWWVKTRQQVYSTSFKVALEEEEASTTAHGIETIGWVTIDPSAGSWSGHPYEVGLTPKEVTDAWYTIPFSQDLSGTVPLFFASLEGGGNNSALRYQSLTTSSVQVKIEEDTTFDPETSHTGSHVHYLVIGDPGVLSRAPD